MALLKLKKLPPTTVAVKISRILWIDDDIERYPHAISHLVLGGLSVAVARSYFEAHKIILKFDFDTILLDFKLSDGSTAIDFLEEAVYTQNSRIIILTNFEDIAADSLKERFNTIPVYGKAALLDNARPSIRTSDLINLVLSEDERPAPTKTATFPSDNLNSSSIFRFITWSNLGPISLLCKISMGSIPSVLFLSHLRFLNPQFAEGIAVQSVATVAFVAAYVVYKWRCPPEIQRNNEFIAFYKEQETAFSGIDLKEHIKLEAEKYGVSLSNLQFHNLKAIWAAANNNRKIEQIVFVLLFGIGAIAACYIYLPTILSLTGDGILSIFKGLASMLPKIGG